MLGNGTSRTLPELPAEQYRAAFSEIAAGHLEAFLEAPFLPLAPASLSRRGRSAR